MAAAVLVDQDSSAVAGNRRVGRQGGVGAKKMETELIPSTSDGAAAVVADGAAVER